jgi:hypothetical protein
LEALEKRSGSSPRVPSSPSRRPDRHGFEPRLADALLARMSEAEEPEVSVADSGVSLPDTAEVPPELEREAGALLDETAESRGSSRRRSARPRRLVCFSNAGEAVRLGVGLLAAAGVADEIVAAVETPAGGGRDHAGTLSRPPRHDPQVCQAWLEYADDVGVTRRLGDVRVLTRRYR